MKVAILFATMAVTGAAATLCGCAPPEKADSVSLCDVVKNPGAYDKRLIEVSGDVVQGMEMFNLNSVGACGEAHTSVWLEFGGKEQSGVLYCCGVGASTARREEDLKVQGLRTPLVEDEALRKMQGILSNGRVTGDGVHMNATLVGRYFAGTRYELRDGVERWGGYGHMGMNSLLVIKQVKTVEAAAEVSVVVALCALLKNPAAYDQQLVEVDGTVERGLENFTLMSGGECSDMHTRIWLDYAEPGNPNSSICRALTRESRAPYRARFGAGCAGMPLVEDEALQVFKRKANGAVKAALVGRFFAGEAQSQDGVALWRGFGHLACCSLLVIQQVMAVE